MILQLAPDHVYKQHYVDHYLAKFLGKEITFAEFAQLARNIDIWIVPVVYGEPNTIYIDHPFNY